MMVEKPPPRRDRGRAWGAALTGWRNDPAGVPSLEEAAAVVVDRRRDKRRGVRLNWGKALDPSDRFLCECLVINRSHCGARLQLARRIALPAAFHFFDDAEGALYAARVVWRQGALIGCRLSAAPLRDREDVVMRMSGRYYAL